VKKNQEIQRLYIPVKSRYKHTTSSPAIEKGTFYALNSVTRIFMPFRCLVTYICLYTCGQGMGLRDRIPPDSHFLPECIFGDVIWA